MKVCVQGLWHLGTVTAACLASVGHYVIGLDFDENVVKSLNKGKLPVFEPGLEGLIKSGLHSNKLSFVSEAHNIDFLWVTYDTPVNDDDIADIDFVFSNIEKMIPFLTDNAIVMISSQLPVGSIKKLEEKYKNISFACSPENLRLGNAINVFLNPDRFVVGVRSDKDKLIIEKLLKPITNKIEWMSIESAEMVKHAINSFLATSVVFANEIASICEATGADAKEVERGLKSDIRIGQKAYLAPGVAFSGGTLARDIEFLKSVSKETNLTIPLLESIKTSNDIHKSWTKRKLQKLFPNLENINITIWGIAYKSGTDTLRRSFMVELCNWLISQKANLKIYDPVVKELPIEWKGKVEKLNNLSKSVIDADVLLIGTKYDKYEDFFKTYKGGLMVIDPNRFLEKQSIFNYITIGSSK